MVIVTAIDDTKDRNIIEEGRALADAFGEEFHMVQVHDRAEIEDAAGSEETMLEDATNRASEIAAAVTDEFVPIGRICTPASELSDYTDDADTQYFILGERKRTPISKALFGSVTQAVLLSATCPAS